MSRPHQEIRPSQFILTYGPGSIVETGSGPVVVKSMDEMFRKTRRDPQDFEIWDDRLARAELDGGRIVRVPTNAELELPVDEAVYPTERFPYWALCTQHPPEQILYPAERGCPRCPPATAFRRLQKAGREAIRFVLACKAGHLDNVNWNRVVHPHDGRCQPDHYVWHGGGRALRHVTITCPRCGAQENFGRAYGRTWLCSGRQPELGPRPAQSGCSQEARIFQRGAANLRLAVIATALTILDMPARIHNVLRDQRILAAANTLRSLGQLDEANFRRVIGGVGVPAGPLEILQAAPWAEIHEALEQLMGQQSGSVRPLKDEEFDRLVHAAESGAPAIRPAHPGGPPLFEVRLSDVRRFDGPYGHLRFRVTPVSRLRVVLAQKGYQRVDPQTDSWIGVGFPWLGQTWYPGIELFGEGIFMDLDRADLDLKGSRASVWQGRNAATQAELLSHPSYVWWHTLSHRLLRALSVDSGYSSAAIRERVYLTSDSAGRSHGGLLLYTVQPGGDGTLGGLIALVDRFANVIDSSLSEVDACSNDPLCEEAVEVGAEGSACYSCLLASETSCEHRNLGLDRLLLLENLP